MCTPHTITLINALSHVPRIHSSLNIESGTPHCGELLSAATGDKVRRWSLSRDDVPTTWVGTTVQLLTELVLKRLALSMHSRTGDYPLGQFTMT